MAMNLEFQSVLDELFWIEEQLKFEPDLASIQKEREDALDALLESDPSDPAAFRQAIIDHQDFWKMCHADFREDTSTFNENSFEDSDDFLDPNDDITFAQLRQVAAEQRVKTSLQKRIVTC